MQQFSSQLLPKPSIIYLALQITFSTLSTIACIGVLVLYCRVKSLHAESFKIVILLVASDMIWSILIAVSGSINLTEEPQVNACEVIYVMQISVGLFSVFISSIISTDLLIATFKEPNYFNRVQITIIFIIALIFAAIPSIKNGTAFKTYDDDTFCFIRSGFALYCFFVPIFLCLILNTICIVVTISRLSYISENKRISRYLRRLFIYPLILLITFIPPTIQEIYILQGGQAIPEPVAILISILQSSFGLFDSLAYCVTAFQNHMQLHDSLDSTKWNEQDMKILECITNN